MTSRIALLSAGLATAVAGTLAALPTTPAVSAEPTVTVNNACLTSVPDPDSPRRSRSATRSSSRPRRPRSARCR